MKGEFKRWVGQSVRGKLKGIDRWLADPTRSWTYFFIKTHDRSLYFVRLFVCFDQVLGCM